MLSKQPKKRARTNSQPAKSVVSFKAPSLKGLSDKGGKLVSVSELIQQARAVSNVNTIEEPSHYKGVEILASISNSSLNNFTSDQVERVYTSISHEVCEQESLLKLNRQHAELVRRENASLEADLPLLEISDIEFGMWSIEMMQRGDFVSITKSTSTGTNSIHDPRLGTTDRSINCSHCKLDYQTCIGHPGYIKLKQRLLHPQHITRILRVLMSVCNCCSRLLCNDESLEQLKIRKYKRDSRLTLLAKSSIGLVCTRPSVLSSSLNSKDDGQLIKCEPNKTFMPKKTTSTGKITYVDEKGPKAMDTDQVLRILHHISEEDSELLGFRKCEHPKNMILRFLVVPPPGIRPAVLGDVRKPDYIDVVYNKIIDLNESINPLTNNDAVLNSTYMEMTSNVNLLFGTSGEDNRSSKPYDSTPDHYKSLKARSHGKGDDKAVKGMLLGKRTDYSARMVVGPGPDLPFGYVGFPLALRHVLTPKEIVTSFNISHLTSLLRRGEIVKVKRSSTTGCSLTETIVDKYGARNMDKCASIKLFIGDTVFRCLEEGDAVIINRQPSLHKYSMLGHLIKLIPGMSFKIHPSTTSPMNCDFDGDEINLHLPQTYAARVEVLTSMNVLYSVMSSEFTCPMMGCIIDAIIGFYKATSSDLDLTKTEWGICTEPLMYCGPGSVYYSGDLNVSLSGRTSDGLVEGSLFERAKRYGVRWYSGRMLLSTLFPPDFTYRKGGVKIVNGIIHPSSSPLSSQDVSKSGNSIIHVMWMTKDGPEKVKRFLTDAPWLVDNYLRLHPVSVGIDDHIVASEGKEVIKDELARAMLVVETLTYESNAVSNKPKSQTDVLDAARREAEITAQLNRATDVGDVVLKKNLLDPLNNLGIGCRSGAKGTMSDLVGMLFGCGTQFRRGKRMHPTKGARMAMFEIGSIDPRASGFVESSYFGGLNPAEYFFCAAASREGIIDTVDTTGIVGALERKIRYWAVDVTILQDGSIRNGKGVIILPFFGLDGFKLEFCCQIPLLSNDLRQASRCGIAANHEAYSSSHITFFCNPLAIALALNAKHGFV